jgi:hypothetical protein
VSDFQLNWPGTQGTVTPFDQYQLRLDPQIEAEIRTIGGGLRGPGSTGDFKLTPLRPGDSASSGVKFGFNTPRPRLLSDDYKLRLDPRLTLGMRTSETREQFKNLYSLWLRPDWSQLQQILHRQPPEWWKLQLAQAYTSAPPASSPPVQGPETPKAAEISDLVSAIWALPMVQQAANRVGDDTTLSLRRGSTAEHAAVIGGAVVHLATLTPLLIEQRYRKQAFDFIQGKEIPVPGVRGGSITVLRGGVSAKTDTFVLEGATIGGSYQRGNATTRDSWNIMLTIDIPKMIDGLW